MMELYRSITQRIDITEMSDGNEKTLKNGVNTLLRKNNNN